MVELVRARLRPVPCHARRGGLRSTVRCEVPALHIHSCRGMHGVWDPYLHTHIGRGRRGQWFFWPDPRCTLACIGESQLS